MTESRKYLCLDGGCDILLPCTSAQYFFLTDFAFLVCFPECGWPTLNWTINSAKEANNSGERGKSRNSTTQVGSTATAQTDIEWSANICTIISLYFHFRLCTVEKVIQMGNRSYGQRRRQDTTYWIFKKLSQIQSSNTVLYWFISFFVRETLETMHLFHLSLFLFFGSLAFSQYVKVWAIYI